jgi:hypothetical protein
VNNPYGGIGGINSRPQTHARFWRFIRPVTAEQNNQNEYY